MLNSLENSEAYDETEYLLSSCANKSHLIESIKQAQLGELIPLADLLEVVNKTLSVRDSQ